MKLAFIFRTRLQVVSGPLTMKKFSIFRNKIQWQIMDVFVCFILNALLFRAEYRPFQIVLRLVFRSSSP
jgi:hypothetical protein